MPDPTRSSTIIDLGQLAEVLRGAAESVGKFADSIAHMAQLGVNAYDTVAARRTKARLKKITSNLISYRDEFQGPVIENLGQYVESAAWRLRNNPERHESGNNFAKIRKFLRTRWCWMLIAVGALKKHDHFRIVLPPNSRIGHSDPEFVWMYIVSRLASVMEELIKLLSELKAEKSDFVLDEAYHQLSAALNRRVNILQRLIDSPAPQTGEELAAVRKAAHEWKRLHIELTRSVEALSRYLKEPV